MIKLIKKQISPPFVRHVLTLMSGTTLAQAIPVLISPILTRIYTPFEFGLFAFYMSIVSILTIFSTGRYELAIMLPKKNNDAFNIAALSIVIAIIFGFISSFIIWLFNATIGDKIIEPEAAKYLYYVPASLIIMAILKTSTYWFNRNTQYSTIAGNRFLQSFTTAVVNIGVGVTGIGAIGLILGYMIGQASGASRFIMKEWRKLKEYRVTAASMKEQAKLYNNFPKFLTFAHGVEAASSNLPNILLASFYNTTVVGYYALIVRTISLPLSLIASAIGDIFLQRASNEYNKNGSCHMLFRKTTLILVTISLVPFLLFFFISEQLFVIVFGEGWREAGQYSQILVIPFFLQFIANPVSHIFIIAQKQKVELFLQIFIFVLMTASLLIGYYVFGSFYSSLVLVSVTLSVKYLLFLVLCYHWSKGKLNHTLN